jgi:hypothetical protein
MSRVRPGIPENRGVTSRSPRVPLLLAASALLLTGCVTSSPPIEMPVPTAEVSPLSRPSVSAAPPTTTPVPIPEPSAETTADPTDPEGPPELGSLILTPEGLGTIRLGDDPSSYDPADAMVASVDGACGLPDLTRWEPVYPEGTFSLGFTGDRITLVELWTEEIATVEGLRRWMTREEAFEIYPDARLRDAAPTVEEYVVDREPGDYYFTLALSEQGDSVSSVGATTQSFEGPVGMHGRGESCL